MSNVIRYALIGFGGIAENRIAREGFGLGAGFIRPKNAELVAATDLNASRRQAAETLGLRWSGSAQELFDDKNINAVYIATNNRSHAELAMTAMASGKHCVIEKPMATTIDDARKLVTMAEERTLSLAIDHMMTKNAFNIKAKSLIETGTLGTVNDLCLHMEFLYGSTPEEAKSWRCSSPEEFGGPIGDVASHCLYMAEFLLGSHIASLSCVYLPKHLPIVVEEGARIAFQMVNGLTGSIRVSFGEPRGGLVGTLSNLGYEVYGDKGALRGFGTLFQLSGHPGEPIKIRLELETAEGVRNVTVDKPDNIYKAVVEEHAESVIRGLPMDGSDGLRNLELILAAHESAKGHETSSFGNG